VIVARHPGAVKRATSYAERLRLTIAVIHGEEKLPELEREDGRNSPPPAELENRTSFSLGLELLPSECSGCVCVCVCVCVIDLSATLSVYLFFVTHRGTFERKATNKCCR